MKIIKRNGAEEVFDVEKIIKAVGKANVVVAEKDRLRQDQIVAGNLNGTGNYPTNPGYLAWLYSMGFTQDQFTASGFVVDVTDIPDVKMNDEVTVFGPENAAIGADTADSIAAKTGTINYEIICGISRRVPRVYLRDGAPVRIWNDLEET